MYGWYSEKQAEVGGTVLYQCAATHKPVHVTQVDETPIYPGNWKDVVFIGEVDGYIGKGRESILYTYRKEYPISPKSACEFVERWSRDYKLTFPINKKPKKKHWLCKLRFHKWKFVYVEAPVMSLYHPDLYECMRPECQAVKHDHIGDDSVVFSEPGKMDFPWINVIIGCLVLGAALLTIILSLLGII